MEGMKKKAVVTGASSGIGLAIAEKLLKNGYEVYGIGREFADVKQNSLAGKVSLCAENTDLCTENDDFHAITCDLLDTVALTRAIAEINRDGDIYCLVNNAGVGYYGLHETLKPEEISAMVRTNLEVPMILSNLLLKTIKANRGFIINISSHTASQTNPHGCAYGATKAGLSSFSASLFEEERKYGLKVVTIEPDMTDTRLYRNADFGVDDDHDAYLDPEEIGDAVVYALSQREGCAVTKICLEPKLKRIKRK